MSNTNQNFFQDLVKTRGQDKKDLIENNDRIENSEESQQSVVLLDTEEEVRITLQYSDSDSQDTSPKKNNKSKLVSNEDAQTYIQQQKQRNSIKEQLKSKQFATEKNYYQSQQRRNTQIDPKQVQLQKKKQITKDLQTKEDIEGMQSDPVSAKENIQKYMQNYGINIEIPTQKIQICRFFPCDPRYSVKLVQYYIPGDFEINDDIDVQNEVDEDEENSPQKKEGDNEFGLSPLKFDMRKLNPINAIKNNSKEDEDISEESESFILDYNNTPKNDKGQNHITKSSVVTHKIDGRQVQKSFKQKYGKFQNGFYLKLMFNESGKGTKQVGEIQLEKNSKAQIQNIEMKFSHDSRYLAIFVIETGTLRIFEIQNIDNKPNIQSFFQNTEQKVKNNKDFQQQKDFAYWTYKGKGGLDWVKNIQFDKNNESMILQGLNKFLILNIKNKQLIETVDLKQFQDENYQYERILDVVFDSGSRPPFKDLKKQQNFQCQIACKKKGMKQVDVFDISTDFQNTDNLSYLRSIPYLYDLSYKDLYAKISYDFMKVLVINGQQENFILEYDNLIENNQIQSILKQTSIRRLPQLNQKKVMFLKSDQFGNFFIVCSYEFDHELSIVYSESSLNQFELLIQRTIQPGVVQCFDMNIEFKEQVGDCHLKLLSATDNGFTLDIAKFKYKQTLIEKDVFQKRLIIEDIKKQKVEYEVDRRASIQAFSTKWPYVAFSVIHSNYMILLNAYDNNIIHRIQIPSLPDKICHSFITETNDLFIMTQKDDYYFLYKIDLDKGNRRENNLQESVDVYKVQNIFKYSQKQVGNQPFLDMHVRGCSTKEKVDNNERLMVFFLHQGSLYQWLQKIKDKEQSQNQFIKINRLQTEYQNLSKQQIISDEKKMNCMNSINNAYNQYLPLQDDMFTNTDKVIQTVSQNLLKQDDQCFYIQTNQTKNNEQEIFIQKILRFDMDFSDKSITNVFQEYYNNEIIINFNLDITDNKLIIFSKVQKLSDFNNSKKITIFDLKTKKIEIEMVLKDQRLVGRFESGIYKVSNGHIYFGNNVIKMRYDLVSKFGGNQLTEEDFFNKYNDIFQLKNNDEFILGSTPIICNIFRKFVYIIKNVTAMKPNQVLILPFLHQQRIYLHRFKENTQYFYTSIQKIEYFDQKKGEKNQTLFSYNKYKNLQDKNKRLTSSIICMNLTESKYYVFSERGLLQNRVDFTQIMEQYLAIKAISPNGRNFILLKKVKKSDDKQLNNAQSQDVVISIFHLSEYQFEFVKSIEISSQIKQYIENLQKPLQDTKKKLNQKSEQRKIQGKKLAALITQSNAPNNWIFNPSQVQYQFQINDKMDVTIKINSKDKSNIIEEKIDQNIQLKTAKTLLQTLNFVKESNVEINKESSRFLRYKQIYFFIGGPVGVPSKKSSVFDGEVYDILFPNKKDEEKNVGSITSQNFLFFHGRYQKNLLLSSEQQNNEISISELYSQPLLIKDLLISKEKYNFESRKFLLHNDYMVFWDSFQIFTINLMTKELKQLDIEIKNSQNNLNDDNQQRKKIIDVRIGSSKKYIAIFVNINVNQDCIIIWNLVDNSEKIAVDVSNNYEVLWDIKGYPYIIEENRVWFIKERIYLTCFENQNIQSLKDLSKKFNCSQGHRFDAQNRNFYINSNFLSLPFSFMHFAMMNKIQNQDSSINNIVFDETAYNYLFNNSTAFLDGNFVRQNHQELEYVLQNLQKLNVQYLNQLHFQKAMMLPYSNIFTVKTNYLKIRETALHVAFKIKNNRTIDILMKYLSLNPTDASHFYKDILSQLVDQSSFTAFLKSLIYQNYQMSDKYILNLPLNIEPYKSNIIAINDSNKQYIDQSYFQKKFEEVNEAEKDFKSYPVNVQAMSINWILNLRKNKKQQNDDKIQDEIDYGYEFLYAIKNSQNLSIFEDPTIVMLAEYFYSKYLPRIKFVAFPFVVLQIVVFYATIYLNENKFIFLNSQDPNLALIQSQNFNFSDNQWVIYYEQNGAVKIVFTCLNIILTAYEGYRLIRKLIFVNQKITFVTDLWNCFNTAYVCLNISLSALILISKDQKYTEIERQIEAFLVILVLVKLLYYMKLIEQIAKHIDIFFIITQDIGSFLILYAIMIFAFGNSYYFLGKNQLQFDIGTVDQGQAWVNSSYAPPGTTAFQYPPYNDLANSIFYFYSTIGVGSPANPPQYAASEEGTNPWLIGLFCLAASLINIHLLNMLIALMGDTFSTSNDVYSKIKVKEKLAFILDNWLDRDKVIEDCSNVKYIICAFFSEDRDQNQDNLTTFSNSFTSIQNDFVKMRDNILDKFKELHHLSEEQSKKNDFIKQLIEDAQLLKK